MPLKTHENIYKELVKCITADGALLEVSKYFKELKSDSERIAECFCLLKNYYLLPNIIEEMPKKCAALSEKYRNDGNRAYVRNDNLMSLYFYTKSVNSAPMGSKELALAFANRSAATFCLEDFSDAIRDVERALGGDYPSHLKYKLWDRKGKSLLKLGKLQEAKIALEHSLKWLSESNLSDKKSQEVSNHLYSLLYSCSQVHIIKSNVVANVPTLTHGPNPHIQSASSALRIAYSDQMGRYLLATTDINPGDVLAIENPYASVAHPNSYVFHCFYCHKRCHSMVPCLQCSLVCFCDEACRTKSWDENHSIECSLLKPLQKLGCKSFELLSLRVLINATAKGENLSRLFSSLTDLESYENPERKGFTSNIYLSDSYKSIHNLEGNTHLRNSAYLLGRSVVACCMVYLLEVCSSFFERDTFVDIDLGNYLELEKRTGIRWDKIFAGGLLLKYLQSMALNAHEVSEMRMMPTFDKETETKFKIKATEIGSAAFSLLSLINHSCDPNVVRHSYCGSTNILTAIQFIKKGDQIFDNYGYHHALHTKTERHDHLEYQYHFSCLCIACVEDWPLFVNLPDKNPSYLPGVNPAAVTESSKKFKEILYKTLHNFSDEHLKEWLHFLYFHLKLLQKSINRPWKEFNECQETIKHCLSYCANHHIYRSFSQSLMYFKDEETDTSPF